MKKVVFTQRVDIIESYGERRDCVDQHIADLLFSCGFLAIPIPNNPNMIDSFTEMIQPDGFFFTGGNDLVEYGGNAPERDVTEKRLIEYAEKKKIPLFGICRGMQIIASYYGVNLVGVDNHIRINHSITGKISRKSVNSFHRLGIKEVTSPLVELARSSDGVIEAIRHESFNIAAIMWHPERVDGFSNDDIELISDFFNGGMMA